MGFWQEGIRKHKVLIMRVGDKREGICRVKWSAAISRGKEHASFRQRVPSTYSDNKRDMTGHKVQKARAQMTRPRKFYMCNHAKSVKLSLAQRIHNLCNCTRKSILQNWSFLMQYSKFAANTFKAFLGFMEALTFFSPPDSNLSHNSVP